MLYVCLLQVLKECVFETKGLVYYSAKLIFSFSFNALDFFYLE